MIAHRNAALSSAVLLLAACGQEQSKAPAAPAPQIAQAVAGQTGAAQAIGCMTYLSLRQTALEIQTPPGDPADVRSALNDWEDLALRTLTEDQVASQFVSSIAVADRASTGEVQATADWCLANTPV